MCTMFCCLIPLDVKEEPLYTVVKLENGKFHRPDLFGLSELSPTYREDSLATVVMEGHVSFSEIEKVLQHRDFRIDWTRGLHDDALAFVPSRHSLVAHHFHLGACIPKKV